MLALISKAYFQSVSLLLELLRPTTRGKLASRALLGAAWLRRPAEAYHLTAQPSLADKLFIHCLTASWYLITSPKAVSSVTKQHPSSKGSTLYATLPQWRPQSQGLTICMHRRQLMAMLWLHREVV